MSESVVSFTKRQVTPYWLLQQLAATPEERG
jgi:hypothetical protein